MCTVRRQLIDPQAGMVSLFLQFLAFSLDSVHDALVPLSFLYRTTALLHCYVIKQKAARLKAWLRRRNTRKKDPQLVAQHCFVASFGRCFSFFTVRNQLVAQQKHLLRVEEKCCEK